jgi:hypothetical protein
MTDRLPLPDLPEPSWDDDRATYQRLAESIEPVAVVGTKDPWAWTALWVAGVVLTLGVLALGISRRRFLDEFATTFVTRQGYPGAWPRLSRLIVAHESRHTTQSTWFGWLFLPIAWINRRLRAWLGAPGFALVYFVLPVPAGFALGRFYLELDADKAAWRLGLREGWLTAAEVVDSAERRGRTMASGAYCWAVPRSYSTRSYRRAARSIVAVWRAGER